MAGGAGNHLFQYCLGRIIASNLGFHLDIVPAHSGLDLIPGCLDSVVGKVYEEPVDQLPPYIELEDILTNLQPRKIELRHFFQNSKYFVPYREDIIRWLRLPNKVVPTGSLVVHIRLGDYDDLSRLSYEYYANAIDSIDHDNLVICTDSPDEPFIKKFMHYNPTISRGSWYHDFCYIMGANKIVLSQSTFSWWAAFLSEANQIVFPLPKSGWWSDRTSIDLRINHPRYIYVDA